jgi:hypothetical protein
VTLTASLVMHNAQCKMTTSTDQLLANVEALTAALQELPPGEAVDKAVYHSERLHLAIRSSHNEATRFAAFSVNKIVGDLGAQAPAPVLEAMTRIRAALEATGVDFHK